MIPSSALGPLLLIVFLVRLSRQGAPLAEPSNRPLPGWALALFPLLLAIMSAPALSAPFLDPEDYFHVVVVQKLLTLSPRTVIRLWAESLWVRPDILNVSFQFALHLPLYLMSRLDPIGYRVANLGLHLGSAWLVVRLGRLLGLSAWSAFAAGLILLLHPLFAEPVLTPCHLVSLLATALFLGALAWWLLRLLEPAPAGPRWPRLATGWALFLCLYATRLSALAFPFALAAIVLMNLPAEAADAQGRRLRALALAVVPMIAIEVAHLVFLFFRIRDDPRFVAFYPGRGLGEYDQVLQGLRPGMIASRLFGYLPRDLLFPFMPQLGLGRAAASMAIFVVAGLAIVAGIRAGRRGLRATVSAACLLGLTVLPFHTALSPEGPTDPILLHLPAAGFALLVVSWIESLPSRRMRATFSGLLVIFLSIGWALGIGEAWRMRERGARQARLEAHFDELTKETVAGAWITLAGEAERDRDELRLLAMRETARRGGYVHRFRILAPAGIGTLPRSLVDFVPSDVPCLPGLLWLGLPTAEGAIADLERVTAYSSQIRGNTREASMGFAPSWRREICHGAEGPVRVVEAERVEESPTLWSLLSRF